MIYTHINRKQSILKGGNVIKNLLSMKPHQQGIHNPLLATDDKGQQRFDGP